MFPRIVRTAAVDVPWPVWSEPYRQPLCFRNESCRESETTDFLRADEPGDRTPRMASELRSASTRFCILCRQE